MNINSNITMPPVAAQPPGENAVEGSKPRETRTADATLAPSVADLAHVAGEEPVDERELRRDDALGQLVARAFDLTAPPWVTDRG